MCVAANKNKKKSLPVIAIILNNAFSNCTSAVDQKRRLTLYTATLIYRFSLIYIDGDQLLLSVAGHKAAPETDLSKQIRQSPPMRAR